MVILMTTVTRTVFPNGGAAWPGADGVTLIVHCDGAVVMTMMRI